MIISDDQIRKLAVSLHETSVAYAKSADEAKLVKELQSGASSLLSDRIYPFVCSPRAVCKGDARTAFSNVLICFSPKNERVRASRGT